MSRLEIILFFTLLRPYFIPCRSSIIAEKLPSQALEAIPKFQKYSPVTAVWPLRSYWQFTPTQRCRFRNRADLDLSICGELRLPVAMSLQTIAQPLHARV